MEKSFINYENKTSGLLKVSLLICGILLVVSVCNLFGYAFFSSGVSLVSGKSFNANNFYAIQLEKFDDYNQAQNFATELQKLGGAGYVTYNKGYRVLSSMYLTYDQAKSVMDNVKVDYPNVCVYELCIPEVNLPNDISEEQLKVLSTSLAVSKSTISTLYNLYVGIDSGEIKDDTAKSMLKALTDDCNSQLTSFKTAFHSKDTATYLKYKMYLSDLASNIAEISNIGLNGSELSQIIKYQQLKCVFVYINMCKLFE